jgi:hypothetical protein
MYGLCPFLLHNVKDTLRYKEMNRALFEICMEHLATALHATILEHGLASFNGEDTKRVPQYINTALHVFAQCRASPITLDEEDIVEEAMCDAERRIQFGFQQPHLYLLHQHSFLYKQLASAFSATDARKGLFRGDVNRSILYTILEEYE